MPLGAPRARPQPPRAQAASTEQIEAAEAASNGNGSGKNGNGSGSYASGTSLLSNGAGDAALSVLSSAEDLPLDAGQDVEGFMVSKELSKGLSRSLSVSTVCWTAQERVGQAGGLGGKGPGAAVPTVERSKGREYDMIHSGGRAAQ